MPAMQRLYAALAAHGLRAARGLGRRRATPRSRRSATRLGLSLPDPARPRPAQVSDALSEPALPGELADRPRRHDRRALHRPARLGRAGLRERIRALLPADAGAAAAIAHGLRAAAVARSRLERGDDEALRCSRSASCWRRALWALRSIRTPASSGAACDGCGAPARALRRGRAEALRTRDRARSSARRSALEREPLALERAIRARLGLARPGETLIVRVRADAREARESLTRLSPRATSAAMREAPAPSPRRRDPDARSRRRRATGRRPSSRSRRRARRSTGTSRATPRCCSRSALRRPPREIAERLVERARATRAAWSRAPRSPGPGFVNLWLADAALAGPARERARGGRALRAQRAAARASACRWSSCRRTRPGRSRSATAARRCSATASRACSRRPAATSRASTTSTTAAARCACSASR